MHDQSKIVLRKLERTYDPTDRIAAMRALEEANDCNCLLTGLIYVNPEQPSLRDIYNLSETPLNRLPPERIRPPRETMQRVNDLMF